MEIQLIPSIEKNYPILYPTLSAARLSRHRRLSPLYWQNRQFSNLDQSTFSCPCRRHVMRRQRFIRQRFCQDELRTTNRLGIAVAFPSPSSADGWNFCFYSTLISIDSGFTFSVFWIWRFSIPSLNEALILVSLILSGNVKLRVKLP